MMRWSSSPGDCELRRAAARSLARRARYRARAGAAVGGARRPARSRPICATASRRRARLRDGLREDCAGRAKRRRRIGRHHPGHRRGVAPVRPAGIAAGGRAALSRARWRLHREPACMRRWMRCARLRDESRRVIAGLEGKYRQRQRRRRSCKIKHNGVLGYFIEVTPAACRQADGGDNATLFRHRQTMAGAVRFSTDELATLASASPKPREQALALERALFDEMAALALEHARSAGRASPMRLAVLDVAVRAGRTRGRRALCAARRSTMAWPSRSRAAVIRWWKRRWQADQCARASCPMIAICRRTARAGCGWSPAPTWRANPPSCARTR